MRIVASIDVGQQWSGRVVLLDNAPQLQVKTDNRWTVARDYPATEYALMAALRRLMQQASEAASNKIS